MKENDVKIAIIEASSHALEQNRLDGIEVEIGCYTNISSEHMDYHKNMDNYKKAKEKLMQKSNICIVNIDDEYGKYLKSKYQGISFGYSAKEKTDFYVENVEVDSFGCRYDFCYEKGTFKVSTNITGTFTIYNTLLAVSSALALGIDKTDIINGIKSTKVIKGRMEKYKNKPIYIDYAHTPDAMAKVIGTIKELEASKRLVVMFGCGGDRDKSKRAEMGRIASQMADLVVVTSDNSRSENLNEIISDIVRGIVENKEFVVIPNRKIAIQLVAKNLKNDALLLLGKGHEEYEIDKNGKRYFSERKILDEVFSLDS